MRPGPWCLLLAFPVLSTVGEAQEAPESIRGVMCATCTLSVEHVVDLGEADGVGAIGPIASVSQSSVGEYLVVHHPVDTEIVVFSEEGRPLRRVGRKGEGPGEFDFIRWVRVAGPRIHVFDMALRRQTVYSNALDEPVSISRFPVVGLGGIAVVDDSTSVVNAVVRTSDRIGFLLHVVGNGGEIPLSFAEHPRGFQFNAPESLYMRALAPSSGGGVWAAHLCEYQIERWALDGTLLDSFVVERDWFPPGDGRYSYDPHRPHAPKILDVREDDAGRIWTLIRVSSDDWSDSLVRRSRPGASRVRWGVDDLDKAFDTVIEVIDPRQRKVLLSERFDQALITFVGDGRAASYSLEEGEMVPKVRIWQLLFRQEQPGDS